MALRSVIVSTDMYRLAYGAPVETTRPSEAYTSTTDAGLDVVMIREVVTSVEDDHRAVRELELGVCPVSLDESSVAGSRDMQSKMTSSDGRSERCPPSAMPSGPYSMMRNNGSSALKSLGPVIAVVTMELFSIHALAVRPAKSANLIESFR